MGIQKMHVTRLLNATGFFWVESKFCNRNREFNYSANWKISDAKNAIRLSEENK
jgi:hypothetical protein